MGEGRHEAVRRDLAALFTLAWPVVISRLGMMTMGLSDAIVVGRYSAVQLGWHAMAWAPSTVVLVVGTALLGGVQVMTARAIGEGRPEETGAVLRRGLVYGIKVGVFAAAALFFLGPWLLGLLQLPDDLVAGATPPQTQQAAANGTNGVNAAMAYGTDGTLAAVFDGTPGALRLERLPLPIPTGGAMRVRVLGCTL